MWVEKKKRTISDYCLISVWTSKMSPFSLLYQIWNDIWLIRKTKQNINLCFFFFVPESSWCSLRFCLHIQSTSCWKVLELLVSHFKRYSLHHLIISSGRGPCHGSHVFSGIRAYEQLGNRAFGPPGKMLAATVITIHNIGGNTALFSVYKINICSTVPKLTLTKCPLFFCSLCCCQTFFLGKSDKCRETEAHSPQI